MARGRVFIDTNVIIEAFRTGVWAAICEHHAVETVDKCVEEAMSGDSSASGYVPVDADQLAAGLSQRHSVPSIDIATLALGYPDSQGLDAGEMHLLACFRRLCQSSDAAVMVSTADKAAIRVVGLLGRLDSLVALETLAQRSGVRRKQLGSLVRQYRSRWLDDLKTSIRLGLIP